MDVTFSDILLSWKWRFDVALVVGTLVTVYAVGWPRKLRRLYRRL